MKVYLVGSGPGDPELITLKGRRVLERADVVIYDDTVNRALLDLAPPEAERIAAPAPEELRTVTMERARRGLTVVRLMGGDPFLFSRGGEEAVALAAAGVPFEVVPGVAVPLGVAAYTGVPLTHAETAPAVTLTTDWKTARASGALVIQTHPAEFAGIARELLAGGRPGETPAMAVRRPTCPDQQTIVGSLASLPDLLAASGAGPATVVIGEAVNLREKLDWYGRLPLVGRRIVVTRAKGQAETLAARLRALGAETIEMPTIDIRAAQDPGPLDRAIAALPSYDWLIFTSANGVRYFLDRLDRSAVDLRSLKARICAIGPATRAAVEALHLKVDLMGTEYVAEGLLAAFAGYDLAGKRVLLPRAAVARDLVPAELARRGALVDVVEAYRTVTPENAAAAALEIFCSGRKPEFITFTSSSTVRNFVNVAGATALDGVKTISIGPVTSETARELGVATAAEAQVYTVDGLVDAILRLCASGGTPPPRG